MRSSVESPAGRRLSPAARKRLVVVHVVASVSWPALPWGRRSERQRIRGARA